jgi:hypothetical protein
MALVWCEKLLVNLLSGHDCLGRESGREGQGERKRVREFYPLSPSPLLLLSAGTPAQNYWLVKA